jgi:hypothetical protein
MTNMTPEQENAFYGEPDNQVPQGTAVRRKSKLGEPVPVRFPTSSCKRSAIAQAQPTGRSPTGSDERSSMNSPRSRG